MANPFERLLTTIRPHLPGATEDAIRLELFGVCLEFFDLSNAWQEEIPFIFRAGKDTAEILPTAGSINRLMGVLGENGRPVYGIIMPEIGLLKSRFAPPNDAPMTAVCAITVSDPVSRESLPIVPSSIVQRYTQELIHGICSVMMLQPSKPYSSPSLATYHGVAFRSGAARARNDNNIANTYGSQRWNFPQSFNSYK